MDEGQFFCGDCGCGNMRPGVFRYNKKGERMFASADGFTCGDCGKAFYPQNEQVKLFDEEQEEEPDEEGKE